MGRFLAEFLTGAFAAIVFKFYETEVGLAAGYAAIATIIYSIWNAVNDPIIGYITSKPTPFAKRLGRRFPWILLGTITCAASFILIFAVPSSWDAKTNPLPVFLWMVITICLYDGLYSIWEVNYQSVFPDKFRDPQVRIKTAGVSTVIGVLGIAAGFVIPPMFFSYGDRGSYLTSSWAIAGFAVVAAMLLIPGVREDRPMIDRYLKDVKKSKGAGKEASFFNQMKQAFTKRDFVAFILLYFIYQSGTILMTGSIHYVGDYILPGGSSNTTIIFGGMLAGALVSVPVWTAVSKRLKNNQHMLIISSIWMAICAFPMTFVNGYAGFTLFMALWGMGFGGFWLFMPAAMADVIDGIVVQDKRRQDGIYLGFRAFFGRLSYATQAVTFWAIHTLTGFADDPLSASARLGIHLHMALIPALLFLTGALVFARLNTITPASIEQVRKELRALDL